MDMDKSMGLGLMIQFLGKQGNKDKRIKDRDTDRE